jgi:hypothetical protein
LALAFVVRSRGFFFLHKETGCLVAKRDHLVLCSFKKKFLALLRPWFDRCRLSLLPRGSCRLGFHCIVERGARSLGSRILQRAEGGGGRFSQVVTRGLHLFSSKKVQRVDF